MKKLIFLTVLIVLNASCKEDEAPAPIVPLLATITTANASALTSTTATSGGTITNDGGAAISERGICYNTAGNPTTANSKVISGSGTGSFTANLTGLSGGTIYYVRAYAINSAGTAYGNEISFTPIPLLATITTANTSAIASTTATSGGNITNNGGAVITERGICYHTAANPTITNSKVVSGSGTGSFTANITGLTGGTLYYLRAYAINSAGTAYGNEISFTTQAVTTVTDIDGNIYNTVTIGSQTWMKENLKVTHYRNGDPIANVTNNTAWSTLTTGAYANYNNDAANVATYGRLYNWYAVKDARNIVPTGWHVPTDAELNTLVAYLGGQTIAGGKLKEAGTTHWKSPNTGATNSSGFTALPGGTRFSDDGVFWLITEYGYVWSSVEYDINNAWGGGVYYNGNDVLAGSYYDKAEGFSVRCVKD